MEFALSETGERVKATKSTKGFCDMCGKPLIPKCGSIRQPHWAHKSARDCDPWWEPESDWHRNWKNLVDENFREKVIVKNGVKHRADIQLVSGIVVELQNSPLSFDERCEREAFYEKMLWIIHLPNAKITNCEHSEENDFFGDISVQIKNINEWIYRAPHLSPIFLDFGDKDKIFHITEFDDPSTKKRTRNLHGTYFDKKEFINFLGPTSLEFDLTPINLSHFHQDYRIIQEKMYFANNRLHIAREELRVLKQQKEFKEKNDEVQRINEELRKKDEDETKKRQYEKDARKRQRDGEIAKKQQDEEEVARKRQEIMDNFDKTIRAYTYGPRTE